MAVLLRTSLKLFVLVVVLVIEHCDSSSLELLPQNVPHKRVKRSGLVDADLKPNDQIEKVEIVKDLFYIYRKRLNWKAAHDVCENKEGHLASFLTQAQAEEAIKSIFALSKFDEDYDWGRKPEEFGLDRRYWIGLSDLFKDGEWTWVGRGQLLTYGTMWYPGQPDHVYPNGTVKSGRHQHCGSLWNPAYFKVGADKKPTEKHTFDDLECDRELYFICQKDAQKLADRENALKG